MSPQACVLLLFSCLMEPLAVHAYMLSEIPRDMVVGENLYILGSEGLTQLHRNLSYNNQVSLLNLDGRAVKMILDEELFLVVICSIHGECRQFDAEQLDDLEVSFSIPQPSGFVVSTVNAISLYTASFSQNPEPSILIQQHEIDYLHFGARTLRSLQFPVNNNAFTTRKFVSTFRFRQYVYFVSIDSMLASSDTLTITRVCNNEPEDEMFSDDYDMYETTLLCGQYNIDGANITGVLMLDSVLMLGLSDERYSRQCSFNLSVVNAHLDSTFDNCVMGSDSVPLPWARNNEYQCSDFSGTRCNFGSVNSGEDVVPALAANTPVVGNITLELWNYSVTAFLPVVAEGAQMFYLGASNTTGHYLLKFHLSESRVAVLVEEYELQHPVTVLRHSQDYVYCATTNQISRYAVNDCAKHNTCESCAASRDPLCGWCVIEDKCSSQPMCKSHNLLGRWVQRQEQCIANVTLSDKYAAINENSVVVFQTIPHTSVFPSLSETESFVCMLTDIRNNTTYNWTVVGSTCVGKGLSLDDSSYARFSVAIAHNDVIIFHMSSLLTIINCSQFNRCITCQQAPPCGWCVYDHQCTGNSSLCRQPSDWKLPSKHAHTCPVVLRPPGGRYLQPVGVNKQLNLTTQNIPSPIEGFKYICRVEYLESQHTIFDVDALYINDSSEQIGCLFKENQTATGFLFGVEGARLSLVYTDSSHSSTQEVEFVRGNNSEFYQLDAVSGSALPQPPTPEPTPDMLLYNCSQLSNSCSSCVALRLRPESLHCGWCNRGVLGSTCTVTEECHGPNSDNFFIMNVEGKFCPNPVVRSVSPVSGPIHGGTVITISGTDLGVRLSSLRSISLGDFPCTVITNEYIAGQVIKCRTGPTSGVGQVKISLRIGQRNQTFSGFVFSYENPVISSVVPRYGPSSGGTLVTIYGSSLNVGSDETREVTLGGHKCPIVSVNSTQVRCLAPPADVVSGLVQLSIDGAALAEGDYSYHPDPVVYSVSPTNTIESGGVKLTFMGTGLNNTYQPQLVVYDQTGTHYGTCIVINESALMCIAPSVQPLVRDVGKRSRDLVLQRVLNYTLLMDNAPGPNITSPALTLLVRADPVFTEINEPDRIHIQGSNKQISILGRDITSVHPAEVTVIVDELRCDTVVLSSTVLSCRPPSYIGGPTQTVNAEVKVIVAGRTLEYSVGVLRYVPSHYLSLTSAELIAVTTSSSLVLVVALLAVCIIVVMCVYNRKRTKRVNHQEMVGYSGRLTYEERITDFSHENVYEDINDIIFTSNGLSELKMVEGDERYQGSLTQGKRTLPEVPSEEYIEMGAHSVRQTENEPPQPRTEVARRNEDGTIIPSSLLISGEYVDMLPTTVSVKGRPDSYVLHSPRLSSGQSESVLTPTICVCTGERGREEQEERDRVLSCGTI